MIALYKKELLTYFKTPLGYLFLALILFFTGSIFTLSFLFRANQDFSAYLRVLTSLFAIIIPLLTMRTYSEEFKNKTDQLLFTQPIALHDIVIAKFLAMLTIFNIIIMIISMYLIILKAFGFPDWIHILTSLIGFILLGATLLSLGMLISSYSSHQFLTAIISFIVIILIITLTSLSPILPKSPSASLIVLFLVLMLMCFHLYHKTRSILLSLIFFMIVFSLIITILIYNKNIYRGLIAKILQMVSPLHRYENFHSGIIYINDIFYFLIAIFTLQYLIYTKLESHYYKEK